MTNNRPLCQKCNYFHDPGDNCEFYDDFGNPVINKNDMRTPLEYSITNKNIYLENLVNQLRSLDTNNNFKYKIQIREDAPDWLIITNLKDNKDAIGTSDGRKFIIIYSDGRVIKFPLVLTASDVEFIFKNFEFFKAVNVP